MTSISNRKSNDTIIAEFAYSYDPTYWGKNGTRTRAVENILKPDGNRISAQVDYEYDDLYRLVHEHRIAYNGGDPGVAYEYNFAYDDAGNRTSWQTVGGSTISYTYDAANKMLTAGNSTFTYDDKGNTLTETNGSIVTTYTWDYLNRLTEWQKTGETTQTYVYNADGMRVRVTPSGGTATNCLLDDGEIAEEITGASVTAYIGPGLICRISGVDRTVYHADSLGTTRAISGSDQSVAHAGIYDAYGNLAQDFPSSSSPSFGYAGQHRYYADSTGLDYLKARYYDPAVGRFLSRDPIGYADELNLYVYCGNNPVTQIDPSGMYKLPDGSTATDPLECVIWLNEDRMKIRRDFSECVGKATAEYTKEQYKCMAKPPGKREQCLAKAAAKLAYKIKKCEKKRDCALKKSTNECKKCMRALHGNPKDCTDRRLP